MKTLKTILCLLLMITTLMPVKASGDMKWERTWLDQLTLRWEPPVQEGSSFVALPTDQWKPQFGYNINHSCTFTDGKYIYSGYSPFCKYTMEGEYVETMETDELADVWKVAYDGENFYMMMWERLGLYIVDPETFHIKGVLPTPATFSHFTYIPTLDEGKGGFLIGTINHLYFMSRYGDLYEDVIDMTPEISDKYHCASTAYLNGKIYCYCDDNKGGRVILSYDAATLKYTGERFDLNDFAGQGIVPANHVARQIFPYTRPDNRQYLLCVDYNYSTFFVTSVLIGEQPVKDGVTGYNLYRNGQKINTEPLGVNDYMFKDSGLEENVQYKYELKAVTSSDEGDVVAGTSLVLPDTKRLPMLEEFDTYVHPSENWFRMWTFPTNFLFVDNPGEEDSWRVVSYRKNTGNSYIQYYHGSDETYSKSLVVRPLKAREGATVMIGVDYSGNTNLGSVLDDELMHIEVSTDNMKTWKTVGTMKYRQSAYNYETFKVDVTEAVGNNEFVVRLRPDGQHLAGNSAKYSWQIAAINVWDELPLEIGGKVTYNGNTPDNPLGITFTHRDLGTIFETTTDNSGNYVVNDLHAGSYDVNFSNGKYSNVLKDFSFEESGKTYSFNLSGGKFSSSKTSVDQKMRPGAEMKIEMPLSNSGVSTSPYAYFEFEGTDKEQVGQNDIKATPDWKVLGDFAPYDVYRNGAPVYYKGYYYIKSENDQYIYINKHDASGKFIEKIYLKDDTNLGHLPADYFIYKDKLYAYTLPSYSGNPQTQGICIAEVDLDNKQVLFSKKLTLPSDISYVTGLCADPLSDGFYVLYYYTLWKLNGQGKIQTQWQLQGGQYGGLAFDSFSEGGPYLWTVRMDNNQKGIYVEQFDLSTGYFTTNGHYVNSDPVSVGNMPEISSVNNAGQVFLSALGVKGSTEICPGYFSIVAYQEFIKSTPIARQAIVYRLFPIQEWINTENTENAIDGEGNITLNFDTRKLADGETREAKLIISASNVSDDVVIPVKLSVDNSLSSQWPIPEVSAEVTPEYNVNLNWDKPSSSNEVKGYKISKAGLVIGETSTPGYIDEYPYYGKQSYTVTTEYADGTIVVSEAVEAEVLNNSLAVPVENFKASPKVRKNVELTWDRTPKFNNAFYEDFESYEPFITENIGDWTMYDFDRSFAYSNGSYDYPNEGGKMSGQIFNPSKTQPANTSFIGNGSSQYLAFTCSNLTLIKNDDWMITPELNLPGQSIVRFEGRANTIYRNKEKLLVGYSTSGIQPEDFKWIGDTIMFNDTWSNIEMSIPAETKHVAFRYVSQDVYQLYLDNIYIGPRGGYSAIKGWNVYRDGEKINSRLLTTNNYLDLSLDNGDYHYSLETVYENGSTALSETDITINADIQANPPRDFTAVEFEEGKVELNWRNPALADTERLRYDDGIPAWGMNTGDGKKLWVACQWKPEDLDMYLGYSISNIHFHILENCKSVTPFVIEGNNTYIHTAEPFAPKVGEWNDYILPNPIKIEKDKTYRIGYIFESDHPEDEYPASQDMGPGHPGTSDLFSADGKYFYSMFNIMGDEEYNLNWCIAMDLDLLPEFGGEPSNKVRVNVPGLDVQPVYPKGMEPKEEVETQTAIDINKVVKSMSRKNVSADDRKLAEDDSERFLGFNVYCNDNRLNNEILTDLNFVDLNMPENYAEYYVTAVYRKAGEVKSEVVSFGTNSMIPVFQNPDGPFNVYSIDGILLYKNVNSVKELEKGLYIINGQKVLIK